MAQARHIATPIEHDHEGNRYTYCPDCKKKFLVNDIRVDLGISHPACNLVLHPFHTEPTQEA